MAISRDRYPHSVSVDALHRSIKAARGSSDPTAVRAPPLLMITPNLGGRLSIALPLSRTFQNPYSLLFKVHFPEAGFALWRYEAQAYFV